MVKKNMYVYRGYMDLRGDPIHRYTEEELFETPFDEEEILSSIRSGTSYNNFFWKRTKEEVDVEEDPSKILREKILNNSTNKNTTTKLSVEKTISYFLKQLSDHLKTEIKDNKKLCFKRTKKNNPGLFLRGYDKTVAVAYSCRLADNENIELNIFYDYYYIKKEEAQKYVSDFLAKNQYEVIAGRKINVTFSEKHRGI